MGFFVLAAIVIFAIALDWWDKNGHKVDTWFDDLENRIRNFFRNLFK